MTVSNQQRTILTALARIEAEILAGDDEYARREMAADGIPWRVERIVQHQPTASESASFSRGLRKLADGGFVRLVFWAQTRQVYGVKFTAAGREVLKNVTAGSAK